MIKLNDLFVNFLMVISFVTSNLIAQNSDSEPTQEISDLNSLVMTNNDFGMEIYRQLSQNEENLVFSPYNLSTALQMLYAGSQGLTQSQMARILHFVLAPEQLYQSAAELSHSLTSNRKGVYEDSFLTISNSIWVQSGHAILPEFEKTVTEKFKGAVKAADFINKADASRVEINQWIKSQTRGKITDLLGPRDISETSRIVLVSALFMSGKWQNQFDPNLTRPTAFFPYPSKTITVPMMSVTDYFPYIQQTDFSMVELPYSTKAPSPKLSMLIVLPHKTFGLKDVERSLSAQRLLSLVGQMKPARLTVTVPKFKISSNYSLRQVLEKLGLIDPFSAKADFSGINGAQNLMVSNVLQKAYITIDEKGTEAGVATAVPMGLKAIREPTPELFLADHPFQFYVIDKLSGSIIFMGRIIQP